MYMFEEDEYDDPDDVDDRDDVEVLVVAFEVAFVEEDSFSWGLKRIIQTQESCSSSTVAVIVAVPEPRTVIFPWLSTSKTEGLEDDQ